MKVYVITFESLGVYRPAIKEVFEIYLNEQEAEKRAEELNDYKEKDDQLFEVEEMEVK